MGKRTGKGWDKIPRKGGKDVQGKRGYLMLFTTGPENIDRHPDLLTQTALESRFLSTRFNVSSLNYFDFLWVVFLY